MAIEEKYALVTGSSRGIGRGIALALAESGVKIGVHYFQNDRAANETLKEVRKRGSDGFIVQADVTRPDDIVRMPLVRYFAVAVAKRGITVNAISPGWTEDSVLNTLPEQVQQLIRDWHIGGWTPMGRLGTPADIGDVVVLLCSEKARWITGQTIYADGGASLMNPEVPPQIQLG